MPKIAVLSAAVSVSTEYEHDSDRDRLLGSPIRNATTDEHTLRLELCGHRDDTRFRPTVNRRCAGAPRVSRQTSSSLSDRAPKRVAVSNIGRLVFAGLYHLAPEVLDAV